MKPESVVFWTDKSPEARQLLSFQILFDLEKIGFCVGSEDHRVYFYLWNVPLSEHCIELLSNVGEYKLDGILHVDTDKLTSADNLPFSYKISIDSPAETIFPSQNEGIVFWVNRSPEGKELQPFQLTFELESEMRFTVGNGSVDPDRIYFELWNIPLSSSCIQSLIDVGVEDKLDGRLVVDIDKLTDTNKSPFSFYISMEPPPEADLPSESNLSINKQTNTDEEDDSDWCDSID